jgi:charged multivesicular body protein 3
MGIIDEMMNEAVDSAMSNDDLEEETDEEVKKVLDEILIGKVGQLPTIAREEPTPVKQGDIDSEDEDVAIRLQALRN